MRSRQIAGARALLAERISGATTVTVADGRIVDVRPHAPGDGPAADGLLTAGLLDLQVNGGYGVDVMAADAAGWRLLAAAQLGTGVTSFCPAVVTAPWPTLVEAVERIGRARAALASQPVSRVLGVHLEGPFLSPRRAGVHAVADMSEPTPERVDRLLQLARLGVAVVTLAPELEGGLEAVRRLAAAGLVVSIGHSDATAAVVTGAVDAGARGVTHVFNAQRGLGHREPGVAGSALADDRLTVGLIADLHHVAPAICSVVMRAAAGRVALVTDATAAAGMPPGPYRLAAGEVAVRAAGDPPRRADGMLAGSAQTLDGAVRNLVGIGVPATGALEAASRVPADLLGRADLGRIEPEAAADLVLWDDDLRPVRVWLGGEVAWERVSRAR